MENCVDRHRFAITIAECFVGTTLPISLYHSFEHLRRFVRPSLQSHVVAIIWMVPVYSMECLFSVIYIDYAFYFRAIREVYEAYAVYCFMGFIFRFFGDGQGKYLADRLANMPASMGCHKVPLCWLPPWQMGTNFIQQSKTGVLQFVFIQFWLTISSLLMRYAGRYDDCIYS